MENSANVILVSKKKTKKQQQQQKNPEISQGIQKTFGQTQGFLYSVVESRIPSNNFFFSHFKLFYAIPVMLESII